MSLQQLDYLDRVSDDALLLTVHGSGLTWTSCSGSAIRSRILRILAERRILVY